ncbi:MAG: helix-turn-helix domain-containing protein, partial [Dehalococcoidia bacterium]|nr:helix-turn-helix domain-containing protein [Dehalococcoidia bacterium]
MPSVESPPAPLTAGLRQFEHYIIEVADDLPWFGEEPFKASGRRRPPLPVFSSLSYLRRVLLAFLAGRPMAEIAARAGCGIRTVYKVIGGVVYILPEDDEIPIWFELGLFGVVAPRPDQPPLPLVEVGLMQESVGKNDVLLFCLLCHGFMGGLDNSGFAWRPDPDFGVDLLGPSVIRDRGVPDKL